MRTLPEIPVDDDLDAEIARSIEAADLMLPANAEEVGSEPREAAAMPRASGRADAASFAASVLIHAAVVAALFVGPSGAAWLINVAGKKETGVAAAGDAAADRTQGSRPQPEQAPIHVTLVAPPQRKTSPKRPVSPTPPPRPQPPTRETAKPAPKATETAERTPDKQTTPAPPNILAASTPSAGGKTAPPAAKSEPPKTAGLTKPENPEMPKAPSKPNAPAKPDETTPAQQPSQPAVASAVPVPTPRPAPLARQFAAAPPGDPLAAWRGALPGVLDGTAASTNEGRSESGSGNAAVSDYPGKVARKLQAALRYPPEAARHGITGEARIHFVVDAKGRVRDVELVASSGSELLDRAALETVRRAAPLPPIPKAAGRSEWSFTAPVSFSRISARSR